MDDVSLNNQQRRTFLGVLLAGITAVLGAVFAWPVFRFLAPREQTGASALVRIARKEIPVGAAHFFNFQGRPAVVLQPAPGSFVALTAVCTHLGCLVAQQAGGGFACPCHGSRFAADGQAQNGPASQALRHLALNLNQDGQMVVDRSRPVTPATRLAEDS